MGELVFGLVPLAVAFFLRLGAATVRGEATAGRSIGGILRILSYVALAIGVITVLGSTAVVINAGEVGVRHAFGTVDPPPLLTGIRMVTPWSSVERFTTREEQYPFSGDQVEEIAALSSEQMGMTVDVGLRWQIDPQQASRIYTEIGNEDQIHSAVRNAIRKGIATVTAFFLRDLQPPAQVVQAINNKIAQEQQIETERHRVEVARLQTEQQRLLNQTLSPEALTKQWIEMLHDLKSSNNLIIFVPTEGGLPLLNIGDLRKNLKP